MTGWHCSKITPTEPERDKSDPPGEANGGRICSEASGADVEESAPCKLPKVIDVQPSDCRSSPALEGQRTPSPRSSGRESSVDLGDARGTENNVPMKAIENDGGQGNIVFKDGVEGADISREGADISQEGAAMKEMVDSRCIVLSDDHPRVPSGLFRCVRTVCPPDFFADHSRVNPFFGSAKGGSSPAHICIPCMARWYLKQYLEAETKPLGRHPHDGRLSLWNWWYDLDEGRDAEVAIYGPSLSEDEGVAVAGYNISGKEHRDGGSFDGGTKKRECSTMYYLRVVKENKDCEDALGGISAGKRLCTVKLHEITAEFADFQLKFLKKFHKRVSSDEYSPCKENEACKENEGIALAGIVPHIMVMMDRGSRIRCLSSSIYAYEGIVSAVVKKIFNSKRSTIDMFNTGASIVSDAKEKIEETLEKLGIELPRMSKCKCSMCSVFIRPNKMFSSLLRPLIGMTGVIGVPAVVRIAAMASSLLKAELSEELNEIAEVMNTAVASILPNDLKPDVGTGSSSGSLVEWMRRLALSGPLDNINAYLLSLLNPTLVLSRMVHVSSYMSSADGLRVLETQHGLKLSCNNTFESLKDIDRLLHDHLPLSVGMRGVTFARDLLPKATEPIEPLNTLLSNGLPAVIQLECVLHQLQKEWFKTDVDGVDNGMASVQHYMDLMFQNMSVNKMLLHIMQKYDCSCQVEEGEMDYIFNGIIGEVKISKRDLGQQRGEVKISKRDLVQQRWISKLRRRATNLAANMKQIKPLQRVPKFWEKDSFMREAGHTSLCFVKAFSDSLRQISYKTRTIVSAKYRFVPFVLLHVVYIPMLCITLAGNCTEHMIHNPRRTGYEDYPDATDRSAFECLVREPTVFVFIPLTLGLWALVVFGYELVHSRREILTWYDVLTFKGFFRRYENTLKECGVKLRYDMIDSVVTWEGSDLFSSEISLYYGWAVPRSTKKTNLLRSLAWTLIKPCLPWRWCSPLQCFCCNAVERKVKTIFRKMKKYVLGPCSREDSVRRGRHHDMPCCKRYIMYLHFPTPSSSVHWLCLCALMSFTVAMVPGIVFKDDSSVYLRYGGNEFWQEIHAGDAMLAYVNYLYGVPAYLFAGCVILSSYTRLRRPSMETAYSIESERKKLERCHMHNTVFDGGALYATGQSEENDNEFPRNAERLRRAILRSMENGPDLKRMMHRSDVTESVVVPLIFWVAVVGYSGYFIYVVVGASITWWTPLHLMFILGAALLSSSAGEVYAHFVTAFLRTYAVAALTQSLLSQIVSGSLDLSSSPQFRLGGYRNVPYFSKLKREDLMGWFVVRRFFLRYEFFEEHLRAEGIISFILIMNLLLLVVLVNMYFFERNVRMDIVKFIEEPVTVLLMAWFVFNIGMMILCLQAVAAVNERKHEHVSLLREARQSLWNHLLPM